MDDCSKPTMGCQTSLNSIPWGIEDNDPTPPLALRTKEAAHALSISERYLWQLTKDGKIPCVRLGEGKKKTKLYPVEVLLNWLRTETNAQKGGE